MELEFTTFLFSTIISILLLYILNYIRTKKQTPNLPPGPWKLPIIGNLHQLSGPLPHRQLRDLANKYGPLMHLQLGQVSTVVVSSSEMAEKIMKTHDLIFATRPYNFATNVFTYNSTDIVFSPYGEYWRQLKKICTVELLSAKRVTSFRSIREEEASDLIKWIGSRAGSPINLTQKIYSVSYGVICRASFGKRGEDEDKYLSVVDEIVKVLGGFSVADLFPSIEGFLMWATGRKSKIEKLHSEADRILGRIIDEHRRTKKKDQNLLDVLFSIQEDGDGVLGLTDDNIKGVLLDIISAGSETSATTIDWAMAELIKNPASMKKAQAEVRQVFNRVKKVDETSIGEMKYLKAIVKEVLRLHPPLALLLPRESMETCQIDGIDIPMNTRVIINGWAIGRDPKYWIEPEKFIPERFFESCSHIDYKGIDFQLILFGNGRRICPGISFGVSTVELLLATLLYYFDWKLPEEISYKEMDMTEELGISIRKKQNMVLIPIPHHCY